MKSPLWLLPLVAAAGFSSCSRATHADHYSALDRIREESVRRDLFTLASDSLKGRDTPSAGLDSAAVYIARAFARDGLRPVNGSYFQEVPLCIVSLGEPNALSLRTGSEERAFAIKTEFTPFDVTASRSVRGRVVFAGYGITAPELGYDDYAGLDVRGAVVFVLRHEPGEEDTASAFMGALPTDYSSVGAKVRIAIEHGAVGVLVATDPLNHASLAPRGFPWPSLSQIIPKDALPLTLGMEDSTRLPVVHVGDSVIVRLFGSVDSLRALQQTIDARFRPQSFLIRGAEAVLQTTTEVRTLSARNVVGYLPGSDPVVGHETVIIGAHYDHVGYKKNHAPGERYIYSGADDNASGTCALLGVATALGGLPSPPKRNILCIAFAGEEKGLFGSEYYARRPLFPLSTTVAMLNMDMVGMNAEDTLLLIGTRGSPDLARIAREEVGRIGFVLVDDQLRGGGSDHMSFMKRNIPNLFFHSGLERYYHTVNDRPENIDVRKVARTARLVFLTAHRIANDTLRYRYIPSPVSLF
ncbi:MAG: M28 family peptidase [Bacteroidota bacterium]